jgi:hypothetical protein
MTGRISPEYAAIKALFRQWCSLDTARSKNVISPDLKISNASIYRIIKKHIAVETGKAKDRRKFEAELPNELWQGDCMHGPNVIDRQKNRKAFLFALIDDHSRLITHAQFYLKENLHCCTPSHTRPKEKEKSSVGSELSECASCQNLRRDLR